MISKKAIVISASLLLVGAVAWITSAYTFTSQGSCCGSCATTRVGQWAHSLAATPDEKAKVKALDLTFSQQYAAACAHLCSQRELLAQQLGEPLAGTQAKPLLDQINADQAQLEQLTWDHIVALRDVLPESKRGAFVQAVQKQWKQGLARMKHQADAACAVHPGMKK